MEQRNIWQDGTFGRTLKGIDGAVVQGCAMPRISYRGTRHEICGRNDLEIPGFMLGFSAVFSRFLLARFGIILGIVLGHNLGSVFLSL